MTAKLKHAPGDCDTLPGEAEAGPSPESSVTDLPTPLPILLSDLKAKSSPQQQISAALSGGSLRKAKVTTESSSRGSRNS